MQPPIRLEQVWKTYGSVEAVRGLSLTVPPQSVYGFLRPKGAGKSTTIRMILGLQRPTRGTIALFGCAVADRAILGRVGSLVESPSLYLHLTGRENLEVHRRLLGIPKPAIDRALETVGLRSAAGRVVRQYSFGMKQRLGLAQALLGGPELLVLDEPTNGLDPGGIHEIRELVRDLPKRCGVTVFLSSHLLSEVEQVATDLAILSQGEVKFEGAMASLRAQSKQTVVVKVDQPELATEVLIGMRWTVAREGERLSITSEAVLDAAKINTLLVKSGIGVSHLEARHRTLEDIFLNLTDGQGVEGVAR